MMGISKKIKAYEKKLGATTEDEVKKANSLLDTIANY